MDINLSLIVLCFEEEFGFELNKFEIHSYFGFVGNKRFDYFGLYTVNHEIEQSMVFYFYFF